jgi:hypothetical protein
MRYYVVAFFLLAGCSDHSDTAAEANAKIRSCAAKGMDWGASEGMFGIEHTVCSGPLGSRHQTLELFPE